MNTPSIKEQQQRKIKTQPGFIAALDQSGGSTPKALRAYGIKEGTWSNEEEMFALVHQMRARIMTSPAFTGDRILAAILFENTMDRDIEGRWTIKAAVDEGVPAHVLTAALYERFSSRGAAEFADKLLSAMRYEFGGHLEKSAT